MPWSSDRSPVLRAASTIPAGLAIPAVILMLASGCASVDPGPFQTFQLGAQTLRDGVGQPLQSEVEQARKRAVSDLVANPLGLSGLQLQFGDPEFQWSYPANGPLFTTLEMRNQAVQHLNDAFASYAGLLLDLASVQVLPEAQLDQQVKSINASSRAFLSALGATPAAGVTELLSLGFVEIAREIVEHRKRKRLKQAIEVNQSTVQAFSDAGAQLMTDVAAGIGLEYQSSFGNLQRELVAATLEKRPEALEKILELNQQTQSTLDVLSLLHGSYRALPAAHRELATTSSGGARSHRVEDFLGRAAHLAKLSDSLEKTGGKAGSAKTTTKTPTSTGAATPKGTTPGAPTGTSTKTPTATPTGASPETPASTPAETPAKSPSETPTEPPQAPGETTSEGTP